MKNIGSFRHLIFHVVFAICAAGSLQVQAQQVSWDHIDIAYAAEDPSRQFLNIYLADTADTAPVYFYAHANGGSAYGMPQNDADTIKAAGYTLVSWESVAILAGPEDVLTAWSDAQLAFDWVRANAATYNMDPDRIVIAGRSRGSVASWPLAHSGHAAITGIYMYNALPNSVWQQPELWSPVDDVNADSPPAYLVYGPTPGDGDSHAPENAYPIRDLYIGFGIGDTFTTIDSMTANGITNINYYFPDFIATLDPPAPADMVDNFDGSSTVYSWAETGTWYVNAGTYNQDDITGQAATFAGHPDWTDYTFLADMVTVSSLDPATGWMAGNLAFRVTDSQNMYFLRLNNDGTLVLRSMVAGSSTQVASVATGYSPFTWHDYKVVLNGDSIKVSIDDELLIETTDSDHDSGYIGVRTSSSSVSVDSVSVIQPPGC